MIQTLDGFPGDKALGDKGREKLLPPLVNNIRKGVFDWRLKGYPGISDVTKSLLNFWFNFDHKNNFKYYFAQRESVESVIFLYENQKIKNLSDLLKFDSSNMVVESMFEEDWLRFVIKQATGTGKTKVLSLLIAWCYL